MNYWLFLAGVALYALAGGLTFMTYLLYIPPGGVYLTIYRVGFGKEFVDSKTHDEIENACLWAMVLLWPLYLLSELFVRVLAALAKILLPLTAPKRKATK